MDDTGQQSPKERPLEVSTAQPSPPTRVFTMRPKQQTRGIIWYTSEGGTRLCRWDTAVRHEDIQRMLERDTMIWPPGEIQRLASGYYNRAYTITCWDDGKMDVRVLRVSLPNEPKWKILSERATMEWVARNTDLPVPHIYKTYHDLDRTDPPSSEPGDSPKN